MKRSIFLLAMTLGALASGHAQNELNSSVSVEGIYSPIIIDTDRLNTFPSTYRFELPATDLNYEFKGIVTDFKPSLLTMGVTGRQTGRLRLPYRGFVDFRMGSWLNTRLHAGYNILADDVQTLSADLKFNSSTLWRTRGVPDSYSRPPRKRLYDGYLSLSYSRLLGSEGLLKARIGYGPEYFNYYGTTLPLPLTPAIPTQTVQRANASVGYSSSPSTVEGWHAEGAFNYLGYRRFHEPAISGLSLRGDHESELKIGAGFAFNFAETNAVAVDVDGQFLFYPKRDDILSLPELEKRKNYGVVSLRPSYRFANDLLSLRAGLDVAVSYDAMGKEPGKGFGSVHLAPDISIAYRSESGIGLHLDATGGVTPSTLSLKETFDRYQLPILLTTLPVYTPVDARFGLNIGPFAGFDADVAIRYAAARNVPLGGWYQVYLGTYLPGGLTMDMANLLNPYAQTINMHGISVGLDLSYAYGEMVKVSFNGSYTPQKGERGIFNGFDRPRWVLAAKAEVKPVNRLKIELGYDYRGVRNCYLPGSDADGFVPAAYRLGDITDLNAKITFSLLKNLDIYCAGANLLNRKVQLLPGLQSEGIVISGGFYLEF